MRVAILLFPIRLGVLTEHVKDFETSWFLLSV